MPVHNSEIAAILEQVADLLEIEGASQFRVRAYRDAASSIESQSRRVADMLAQGEDISKLPGVGESIAAKIQEIVDSGGLQQLEELKRHVPAELGELMKVPGLGPKRVRTLYRELGIASMEDLEKAARQEFIRELQGFGPKIEHEILEAVEGIQGREKRTLLIKAEEIAEPLAEYLRKSKQVEEVTIAGSYRRRKETVGDLDLVAMSNSGNEVIDYFIKYDEVDQVLSRGATRSSVVLRSGIQADLRVVPRENYGAALFYFTGSRSHNLKLRNMAIDLEMKINEYGVYQGEERIAGETEEEIYAVFKMAYIEPELRELRGEIEAAQQGTLPKLIRREDIRGDLQSHTIASDGHASVEEMAKAAQKLGYEYLAITEHSEYIGVVRGLSAEKLANQIGEIERFNEKKNGLRLLMGAEVDILEDGSLALPDDIMARLDFRICSVHSHQDLSWKKQTERIIRAMDNPYFNILGHPTGRRINQREPYEVDLEGVMEAALERGCFMELNAFPDRLDLNDIYCKMAKEMGLRLAISTDAHHPGHLEYMRFGIGQARRGWLEPEDVLNTLTWDELQVLFRRG